MSQPLMRLAAATMGVLLFAAACSGSSTPTPTPAPDAGLGGSSPTPTPPLPIGDDLSAVPLVDTAKRSVELKDVIFDTFNGSFVRLSDADEGTIRRLQDRIPPIYATAYESADLASEWLDERDRVIGFEVGSEAFAYPIRTLVFREIVNERFGDVPVAITFCPLCASGVVFDRRVDGRELVFGNTSALYDFDMVMFDHQTGSYWHQQSGRAIVGELTGAELEPLPSMVTTFVEWRELHPNTLVLSNAKDQAARVSDPTERIASSVNGGNFFFPVTDAVTQDTRLDYGAEVLMVRLAGETKAYALDDVAEGPINDLLGGQPVAVLGNSDGMAPYVALVEGRRVTFQRGEGGEANIRFFVDDQTGSVWDLSGTAVSGPSEGDKLTLVPSRRAFWFSIAGSNPGIPLYAR